MLRPGGTVLFAGEPSRYGDRLATRAEALGMGGGAAVAASDRRGPRAPADGGAPDGRWRALSTSTPSPPPTLARSRAAPALRTCA